VDKLLEFERYEVIDLLKVARAASKKKEEKKVEKKE